ncbi:MAG: response regulator [Bacteroidia bacterium]|nr:response regulator [Bacteroidia bacterium]
MAADKKNEMHLKKISDMEEKIKALKSAETLYRQKYSLFIEHLSLPFSHLKVITDGKQSPVDLMFIEINENFEKLIGSGKKEIIGKNITEVLPGIREDKFNWIGLLGETAVTGLSQKTEVYSEVLNKWLYLSLFCPENGHVVALFDDITKIKLHELKIQWGEHKLLEKTQEIASQNEVFRSINEELHSRNINIQKVNEKLFESEGKYHILFESSTEGYFILKENIFDCNNASCEIFGCSREDIIGRHPADLSPIFQPDGRKSTEAANEKIQAALNVEPQYFYWKHKKKDNTLIDTEIILKALPIKGEKFIIATIRDITARLKNEQKIKENERKLGEVYQIAKIGSWQLDIIKREITLSKEHQLLLGIDTISARPVTMSLFEYAEKFIVGDDIPVILKQFQAATNLNEKSSPREPFEYRIKYASGEIRYMEVHAKLFEKDVIYGIIQDITERKLTEQHLISTDRLLKGINQAAGILLTEEQFHDAIFKSLDIIGKTLGITYICIFKNHEDGKKHKMINQKFEWTLTSFITDNPNYKNISYAENGLDRWWTILDSGEIIKGLSKDMPFKEQQFLERKNILSILLIPVFIENKFWGFISFSDDSKYRKWTTAEENLLKNLANSIGGAIAQQIRNEEIVRSKERALESDSLKTAFLANMSHEIRTPMNAILGFTELLKDEGLSAYKRNEFIDIISKRGKDLLNIINDIIDISKIEAGQIKINNIECSLNAIVLELYSIFESDITFKEKKDVSLRARTSLSHKESFVFMDDFRLKQIFTNLIGNAVKFTEKGFIEFGYTLENDMLCFYVEDTGIGISKEKQAIIFDRFRQADDSTTKHYGGTGLGLAISESLVKLMGGYMMLESETGAGSKFSFYLPYRPLSVSSKNTGEEKQDIPKEPDWKNKTILIVEDDHVNFQYLKVLLKKTNAQILRAENGQEAIDLCQKNKHINIVLMDIQMPVMNGFEATKIIKGFRKDLPVIAQTAYAMAEDKEKCVAAGCDEYLSKPIDIKALITITGKYFKN